MIRIPHIATKHYPQTFQGGLQQYTLRSVLGSSGRPSRVFIYTCLDSVMNGEVPQSASTFDFNWDRPRYLQTGAVATDGSDMKLSLTTNGASSARPVDLQELYAVINGTTYPARRLTQDTNINTGQDEGVRMTSGSDYAEAYEYYRKVCAVPHDCPISAYDWQSLKIYVIDLQLTDSMGVADPTTSNVAMDIFITTSGLSPSGSSGDRVVAVMAQYINQITCDASRTYTNGMS